MDIKIKNIFKADNFPKLLLVAVFLIMIFLPLIQMHLRMFPELQSTEKRQMAPLPVLTIRNLNTYPQRYESYFNDNFGFRNSLIKINNYLKVKYLKMAPLRVVLGKDDWFYFDEERGNNSLSLVNYRGLAPYSDQELARIKTNIESQMDWLRKKGILGILIIGPNKETIYPEYLPDSIKRVADHQTRFDQVVNYMKLHSSVRVLDVRDSLIREKEIYNPLYYKTDTHWNLLGAFIACQQIMKVASDHISNLQPISLSDYKISFSNTFYAGPPGNSDLSTMLSCQGMFMDKYAVLTLTNKIVRKNFPKLLLFHDSFGEAMKPCLTNYFNLFTHVDDDGRLSTHQKTIEDIKPDIVVFEVVERNRNFLEN